MDKSRELKRLLDLPGRSRLPMELAVSGRVPTNQLRALGWTLVAKHAYVGSRSGACEYFDSKRDLNRLIDQAARRG